LALILDTNALSAFVEGDRGLLAVIQHRFELAVPVVALGEYLYGIRQSRLRAKYEQWLDANLSLFEILAIDRETAAHYADVRRELKTAGQPIPTNDLWIAALARQHDLPVISRDRHFQAVSGLRVSTWRIPPHR
jgi:tRNA(fMet)-specific endonuclease VapC